MSLNKGKAKVKAKSKSVAKGAGKNKAAVMNSRNPKKPMAISGDTMSNYAMYKKGGKVTKIKKYQFKNSQVITDPSFTPRNNPSIMEGMQNNPYLQNLQAAADSANLAAHRAYMEKLEQKKRERMKYGNTNPTERKKGGSVKAKKFAALAPPYDKATAADRIAGAKKNSRKK